MYLQLTQTSIEHILLVALKSYLVYTFLLSGSFINMFISDQIKLIAVS